MSADRNVDHSRSF